MYLIFNVFTFYHPESRFDRYEVLKYALKTYATIDFKKVYLFIRFDECYANRKEDLQRHVVELFGEDKVEIIWDRYEYQHQWHNFMTRLCSENDPNEAVWFFSNDDHMFIDIDQDLLKEGLELLKTDASPFKTIYTSHWPEMLRYSGKFGHPTVVGNFIKTNILNTDSFQIMNINYLKYFFLEMDWKGTQHKRLDNFKEHFESFGNDFNESPYKEIQENYNIKLTRHHDLQTLFVPMREICRHFDAYDHVKIPIDKSSLFPALVLPEHENDFSYNRELIEKRVKCPHESLWTKGNTFEIPDEWVNHVCRLYKV